MGMKRSTKGFYTLEAAIFLPLVILAVLSLGYFMRIDGAWESCIHGAVDESALISSKSYDGSRAAMTGYKVKNRLMEDNPNLEQVSVDRLRIRYSDTHTDHLTSYRLRAAFKLQLPLGFTHEFQFESGIRYREFTGKKDHNQPMGTAGLESETPQNPVWIFPQSGERYHGEGCTYVKASAAPAALTSSIKKNYGACSLCDSGNMKTGSIIFCFKGDDTAYHRGTCSCIVRHTAIVDKTDAEKRGYTPCSKCGGG